MIVEIARINNNDQAIGLTFPGLPPEQHVTRHFLVGAARCQRIGAGQIDQLDRTAIGKVAAA